MLVVTFGFVAVLVFVAAVPMHATLSYFRTYKSLAVAQQLPLLAFEVEKENNTHMSYTTVYEYSYLFDRAASLALLPFRFAPDPFLDLLPP